MLGNRALRFGSLLEVVRAEPARPLVGLTWALNHAISGLLPWSYHLLNVVVHAVNAALASQLLLWIGRRRGLRDPERAAMLGGALFAVSPMAAETVAYVSSRSTAIASGFVLAGLLNAVPLLEAPTRRRWLAALALACLGLLAKEEAASLPLLLLLLDYFFVAGQSARGVARRWRVHATFLALPLLGLAARAFVTGAWLPAPAMGRRRYLATQLALYPEYVLRTLIPVDPAFYRGHEAAAWPPAAWMVAGWLGTLLLATLAVVGRRRWPLAAFGLAWLAAALLPSSSLLPLKEMLVDHRAYLGGLGLVALVAAGLALLPGQRLAPVLLGLLALVALRYQWVLGSPVRAWQDAVSRAPDAAEAWLALGDSYFASGDPRAEPALREALKLAPADPTGWVNLGAFLAERGRLEEASEAMKRASRLSPADARLHDNLATLYRSLGRHAEVLAELEAAVAGQPPLTQPRVRLASLLIASGDRARAARLLDEAARIGPDPEEAQQILSLQRELGR